MLQIPDFPREGDIWAKAIVQIIEGPANILDLPDTDPRVHEVITFVLVDKDNKAISDAKQAPGTIFRASLVKNPHNGYHLLKEPIVIETTAETLIVFHAMGANGSFDGPKKSLNLKIFRSHGYRLAYRVA